MPAPTPKGNRDREMREAKFANKPKPIVTIEDLELEASAILVRLKAKAPKAPKVAIARKALATTVNNVNNVNNDGTKRQSKWREANVETNRQRAREGMRKRREKS